MRPLRQDFHVEVKKLSDEELPSNDQMMAAIVKITGAKKRTAVWNRTHSKLAGITVNRAYHIRSDIWVVEKDVLYLMIGPDIGATGRADVMKMLIKFIF